MPIRFKAEIDEAAWLKAIGTKQRTVAAAAVAALRDVADASVKEGRIDIGQAGPGFTHAQWQLGLKSRMTGATKNGEPCLTAMATISHRYGIAGVFEFGATIHGNPLLWIPTTHGAPPASKSGKKLVSATVRGKPMLFDANDRDPHRQPLYIGVPSVTIPKKFHIVEIVKKNVANIEQSFSRHFKEDN